MKSNDIAFTFTGLTISIVLFIGMVILVLKAVQTPAGPPAEWQLAPIAEEPAPQATAALAGAETPTVAGRAVITITDGAFAPHTLFVSTGATVRWINEDEMTQIITSNEGWFEGDVAAGTEFTWQPTDPGIVTYHNETAPSHEGVIVVSPGGAVAPDYFNGKSIREYYADSCGGCHGPNREGGTGPALIPARLSAEDEFYFDTIKTGRPGTVMPAWGELGASDEEIWGLIGFMRSEPAASAVEWEMDQILGSLEVLQDEATLPDAPQHSGNLDNLMLVTERESRSIAVIDGDTHTLLGHVPASYRAHGYSFDPTNERWAYNVGRDGWLFKIDLYTLQPVRKVRVGLDSRGLAISDDGQHVIVGNYIPNTAVILDAQTLEPSTVITTEGVNPDGEFVESRVCITSDVSPELVGPYFILALKEAGQIWRIDWSQPDFPIETIENVGRILHDGFLSPDNRYFYLASQTDNWMAVIDVANWELVDQIPTGETPHPGSGAAWAADGTVYGATVHAGEGKVTIWDLQTNAIVGTVATAGPGLFLRSSEHSPYVWADAMFGSPSNTITVFEKEAPFAVVQVIREGDLTLHPEFTADGQFVYISDWNGNAVRVYNAATFEKVAEIDGIEAPTGIFNTSRRHEPLGH